MLFPCLNFQHCYHSPSFGSPSRLSRHKSSQLLVNQHSSSGFPPLDRAFCALDFSTAWPLTYVEPRPSCRPSLFTSQPKGITLFSLLLSYSEEISRSPCHFIYLGGNRLAQQSLQEQLVG